MEKRWSFILIKEPGHSPSYSKKNIEIDYNLNVKVKTIKLLV